MLENGTLIDGKYEILSKIGQGGMSVVYLAMNKKANKQWAIKEVRKDGTKNFEIVKQGLIGEIEMLKKLSHPNLPSIVDVIETDGSFQIVMDYIQGKPLSDALDEFGPQPQEQVIKWALQLCDVLDYLHNQSPPIIYRDMKPSNIMLKPEGDVTLIDFGTAREFKQENIEDTTCLGTQGYAAPEQFGGQGQTDARTDIFTLGATLYHLLTGHNPSDPPYEMYPIRHWNESLSTGLERIILKCTQRNPEHRYQSCAELIYALEHYDEIDDVFRKSQKKKLISFMTTTAFSLIFAGVSLFGYAASVQSKTADYNSKMELADKAPVEEKGQLYIEAINIDPSKKDAYLELVNYFTYTDNYIFTQEESRVIERLKDEKVKGSNSRKLDMLKSDTQAYLDFAYELGMAYWYYYEKPESRKALATPWLAEVAVNETFDLKKKNRSEIFKNIGDFHSNIRRLQDTGEDIGHYALYWSNLHKLKEINDQAPDTDVITVRLYGEIVQQIAIYAKDFKDDGVDKEDIMTMATTIFEEIIEMDKSKVAEETHRLMSLEDYTFNMIKSAYGD